MDVPLLFETQMHRICHLVVCVVITDPKEQLTRLAARDGRGEAEARSRLAAQKLTAADKADRTSRLGGGSAGGRVLAKNGGLVLTNDEGEAALIAKVSHLLRY